jgi:SAM-dependent methyltransferase
MTHDSLSTIDIEKVRQKYNRIGSIWDKNDRWHNYTRNLIQNYLVNFLRHTSTDCEYKILNAGSGGNDYGIKCFEQLHVDIAETKLRGIPNSLISNIEDIPIDGDQFDICICVGSVINYCDATRVIQEFSRLLKPHGYLLLEFECSKSFEFIFKDSFNKSACITNTFYQNSVEELWIYSERYIKGLLQMNKFVINQLRRFHIISPLVYRITQDSNFASGYSRFDSIACKIPFLKTFAGNIILSCEKIS